MLNGRVITFTIELPVFEKATLARRFADGTRLVRHPSLTSGETTAHLAAQAGVVLNIAACLQSFLICLRWSGLETRAEAT